MSQDYEEQIPIGLSQQTMLYPTIDPNITIYVGNQAVITFDKWLLYQSMGKQSGTNCLTA
jgi:hypothetical protein